MFTTLPPAKNQYTADGIVTIFPYTYLIYDEDHLEVVVADLDGVETIQTKTTDYTVDGVDSVTGGNVTFVTAPTDDYVVTIRRKVPLTQPHDWVATGSIDVENLEEVQDLGVMMSQQIDEEVDRSVKIPVSSSLSNIEIPDPAIEANRGMVVATKSDGTGLELLANVPVGSTPAAIGAGDAGKLVIVNATEDGIGAADDGTDISEDLTLSGVLTQSGDNTHSGAEVFSNAAGITTDDLTERTAAAGVTIDGALIKDGYAPFPTGFITGFVPSHGADTAHDMAITAGQCRDNVSGSSDTKNILSAITYTKKGDNPDGGNAWAAGDAANGNFADADFGNNESNHAILIEQDASLGTYDWGWDTDKDGANAPTGWTARCRLFSIRTDGSGNIINGSWIELAGGALNVDYLAYIEELNDYNSATTRQTLALTGIPIDVQFQAKLVLYGNYQSSVAIFWVQPTTFTDVAPADSAFDLKSPAGATASTVSKEVMADTSATIAHRQTNTTSDLSILLKGFIDQRR